MQNAILTDDADSFAEEDCPPWTVEDAPASRTAPVRRKPAVSCRPAAPEPISWRLAALTVLTALTVTWTSWVHVPAEARLPPLVVAAR